MTLIDKHICKRTKCQYAHMLKFTETSFKRFSVHNLLGGLYTLQLSFNVAIDYPSSIVIVYIFTVFAIVLRVCLQWHVNMACSGSSFNI